MAEVDPTEAATDAPDTIVLASPEFGSGEVLAQRYTCDGTNASPPLHWGGVPDGTAELALVVVDLDAERFVHWMIAGLEPNDPGALEEDSVPEGTKVGLNDFDAMNYKGPCPPHDGSTHRYRFTLVASGLPLGLDNRFRAGELFDALEGNVLAKGELIGQYGRQELSGPNPPTYEG
jgi:Raf kinase inhibitor-like YbhB/YbcL family protein